MELIAFEYKKFTDYLLIYAALQTVSYWKCYILPVLLFLLLCVTV